MKFDRWVLYFLLGVLPLAFWPGSTSFSVVKTSVLTICCGLWLVGMSWKLAITKMARPFPWFFLGVAGLWLWLSASAWLTSPFRGMLVQGSLEGLLWICLTYFCWQTLESAETRRRGLAILVASGSLAGLYGLTQMVGWLPGAPMESGYPPGISTLGNQNYLAGLSALLFWPSLGLWRFYPGEREKAFTRTVAILQSLILGITVAVSGTTGAQLSLVFSGVVFLPVWYLKSRNKAQRIPVYLGTTLGLASVGILIALVWMVPHRDSQPSTMKTSLVQSSFLEENHASTRLADWIIARHMLEDFPWTGVGAGGYQAGWIETRARMAAHPVDEYFPSYLPASNWAHNDLWQWSAETGFAGLLLGVMGLLLGVQHWTKRFRRLQSGSHQSEYLLLSCGLVTVAIHSLVSFPFHLPATLLASVFLGSVLFSKGMFEFSTTPSRRSIPAWAGIVFFLIGVLALVSGTSHGVADEALARGKMNYGRGQWEKAVLSLNKADSLWLNNPDTFFYRGLCKMALNQPQNAAEDLEFALQIKPTFSGMLTMAEIQTRLGKHGMAENLVHTVIKCRPYKNQQLQALFLLAKNQIDQGQNDQAMVILEGIIQDDPGQYRALLELGNLARNSGNYPQARVYFEKAISSLENKIKEWKSSPSDASLKILVQHHKGAVASLDSLRTIR